MTLWVWKKELKFRLQHLTIPISRRTVLFSIAGELHGMAISYLNDGDHFLSCQDAVNALASWSYALGWLDAGMSLGLIDTQSHDNGWIFSHISITADLDQKLREKTERYARLLSTALNSATPAPETDTGLHDAADRFCMASGVLGNYGIFFLSSGRMPNALGAFSYSHAWLDAGIRAGLLRVTGSREIFAV
ncbi:MAG: DUF357 domain-containing protein [Methanolinea sp.]|jgi:hypothetical protein|nr:DUF357 domain-containing protein [Methanolinea sp.]